MKPFLRSNWNYDRAAATLDSSLSIPADEEDMTIQSFKDECDINIIMERFGQGAQLPNNLVLPQYGDYNTVLDFHTAMQAVREAEETFMQLPARLRERFNHNPQMFLEFCNDDANYEEAQRMGLVPPPVPAPIVDPKVPPAAPGAGSDGAPKAG